MLSSRQIRGLLGKKYFRRYIQQRVVCGYNELPFHVGLRPAVFIINTLPSYDPNVGHWICCFFKNSVLGNEVLFFDPLGKHYDVYHPDIGRFIRFNSVKITVCAVYPVQSISSTSCGWYCLYFVVGVIKRVSISLLIEKMHEMGEMRMISYLSHL